MKNVLYPIGLLIITLCCPGCAYMNTFNPADVREGTWKHIRSSGIAVDADHAQLLDQVTTEGKKIHFSAADEKVTYWAHFNRTAFPSPYHANFNIRWYDPQGNVFFEEQFPLNDYFDAVFVKAYLPLRDSPAVYFPGLWQVELFYKGYGIDKKIFHILPRDPASYQTLPEAPAVSDDPSALWTAVMQNSLTQEKNEFQERLEKARAYFQEGRFGEAKQILEAILRQEPHRTEAHIGLAAIYFRSGDREAALKELDYALQNPEYREEAYALRRRMAENRGVSL